MNFRRKLTSKLAIVATLLVIASLVIALVAIPAGAINQSPAPPAGGGVLNSPGPMPTMINYQGYLTDSGGNPVNATLDITFSIYEVDVGGTPLWTETQSATVINGLFNVLLGSINPIYVTHLTGESYLGIKVGADPEMTPRQRLASVPYAHRSIFASRANDADNLDSQDSSYYLDASNINAGTLSDTRLSPNVSLLGSSIETGEITDDTILFADIGQNGCATGQVMKWNGTSWVGDSDSDTTYTAGSGLNLSGTMFSVNFAGSGVATTVSRSDHSHDAAYVNKTGDTMTGQLVLPADGLKAGTNQLVLSGGKVGIGTTTPGTYQLNVQGGSNNGIYASSDSYGVYGRGGTYGVFGYHSGTGNSGRIGTSDEGVYGKHQSTGNYGQLGTSNEGVYGSNSDSTNLGSLGSSSWGVRGYSLNNYGVLGQGPNSYGVYGYGITGVQGYNASTGNYGQLGTSTRGVYGEHHDSGNWGQIGTGYEGVYGYSSSGYGIFGESSSSEGVRGKSISGNGVYGYNSDSGNIGILGTSTRGVYGEHHDSGNWGQIGTGYEGVYGYSNSGFGIYGESSSNYGVRGHSNSGTGVYGWATDSYGVHGEGYRGIKGESWFTGNWAEVGTLFCAVNAYGDAYDFYAAGPGVNYGPFTGAHEVKLAADLPQDIRPGMIVSVTGETQVRTDEGEKSYSSTLTTVQLSDTPSDSKVFGVLISESPLPEDHWYEAGEGERFGIVNALGEGRAWVANINGDIEAGDYITTSAIAGYGQKQEDDLLHSYTLGKAIETVDWSQVTETVDFNGQTYKVYAIAVVYTSG